MLNELSGRIGGSGPLELPQSRPIIWRGGASPIDRIDLRMHGRRLVADLTAPMGKGRADTEFMCRRG